MTYTYAKMGVSVGTYAEIKAALLDAEYTHAVDEDHDGGVLDMHGLALVVNEDEAPPPEEMEEWFRRLEMHAFPDGDRPMTREDMRAAFYAGAMTFSRVMMDIQTRFPDEDDQREQFSRLIYAINSMVLGRERSA